MGKSLLLGSQMSWTDGALVRGRAPAKVSAISVTSNPLHNFVRWSLPDDPELAEVAIFRAPHVPSPAFPGGSPLVVVGRANHYKDQDPATIGALYDYWAVTFDKYGNPNPVVAANAVYLGFA